MRGGVFAGVVFAAAACEYGRREKRREERGEERTPGREAEASLKNSGPPRLDDIRAEGRSIRVRVVTI